MKVPNHIAIILDGNGRWAKAKGMPRALGHKQGSKNVEDMCEIMDDIGVKYFTVYAFSTENWNRPDKEVTGIMSLLRNYLKTGIKRANKNNMRIRILGDISRLDEDLQESIVETEKATAANTGLQFQMALNYGSRDEIRRAVTKIAEKVEAGDLKATDITEDTISASLDTAGIPDPDLLIRTSGEQRLSNYLLWQCAYTEFYFTDKHWPDFNKEELLKAIDSYNNRDRRYGKVTEE
ncbi:MAG: isoprenyl transferase [Lachnospiraceae bacterium]|jgi:undecaprenyl diphosphate synthase|nr:isoprenyl transferase [Lachnospiraceae bacterium]